MTTTADPPAAGVLVPYTSQLPPVDTRAFGERWPILTPSSPGRTLNEVYSTVGLALETRSNRMAYRLGLGPDVSAQKIASSFGTGEERQVQLASLRNEIPTKLERYCSRLMDYTLPIESPKTQLQAFKQIITLATDFPGLRFIFLGAKILQSVPIIVEAICALWDRPGSPLDPESLFWQRFAATCLSETNIAVILEQTPVDKLALCLLDSGGLGVIERLLIAYDCGMGSDSTFCNALCIRYLTGILKLPGFWLDTGNVHADVARKLCMKMILILKDIAVDIFPSDENYKSEPPFDYEGVDSLAEIILEGVSPWSNEMDTTKLALQLWYGSFCNLVHLLRRPLSVTLLPKSASCATSDTLERTIPTIYREVEFNVMVETSSTESGLPAGAAHADEAGIYFSDHVDVLQSETKPLGSCPSEELELEPTTIRTTSDASSGNGPTGPFTVAILGGGYVGKSALTTRLVNDSFSDTYEMTIQDRHHCSITVDEQESVLELIDTGTPGIFRRLIEATIESGHGFILVFSLTQESSLEEVDRLRRAIYRIKGRIQVPLIVVGTKSDLEIEREVSSDRIGWLSHMWNIPFYEVSAERNWHVRDAFTDLVRRLRLPAGASESDWDDLVRLPLPPGTSESGPDLVEITTTSDAEVVFPSGAEAIYTSATLSVAASEGSDEDPRVGTSINTPRPRLFLATSTDPPRSNISLRSSISLANSAAMGQFRVVLLGAGGVGKSALLSRLIRGIFQDVFDPTIEDRHRWSIPVDGQNNTLEIIDTGSAEIFPSVTWELEASHGFILVFSLTQEGSMRIVENLRREIYRVKEENSVPIVVVGTQSDRAAQRDVPPHTIEHMSNLWKIPFYVTSAKTNSHVNDAFEGLIRQMRLKYLPGMTGTEELKKRRDNASCGIM